jgi:hypothetical protein
MQRFRPVTALALTLASAFAMADVYKWVDPQGTVHYGDRPPAAGADSSTLTLPPAPSNDPDHRQRILKQRRLLEAFDAERAEQDQAAAEAAATRREQEHRCERAALELAKYESANILLSSDDSGARIYVSDEEREKGIAEMRLWIGKHCN